jgi:hypothetical protein
MYNINKNWKLNMMIASSTLFAILNFAQMGSRKPLITALPECLWGITDAIHNNCSRQVAKKRACY